MRLLAALFSRSPQIGSVWVMREDVGNPFPFNRYIVMQCFQGFVEFSVLGRDAKYLYTSSTREFWFKYFRKELV